MLARTIRITENAGFTPIFVVLGAHADAIQAAIDLSHCTVLLNEEWPEGMASSIRSGIHAVQQETPQTSGVLLLVCDQPALTTEHLRAMQTAHLADSAKIVASHYANRPGVPILAPSSFFLQLLALQGDSGARDFLRAGQASLLEIEFPNGEWDIDRAEDAAALQSGFPLNR